METLGMVDDEREFCGGQGYILKDNKMPWPTLENLSNQIYS